MVVLMAVHRAPQMGIWIRMGRHVRDKELLDEIGLPEDYRIVAPIILGYPMGNIPDMNPRNEPIVLKTVTK